MAKTSGSIQRTQDSSSAPLDFVCPSVASPLGCKCTHCFEQWKLKISTMVQVIPKRLPAMSQRSMKLQKEVWTQYIWVSGPRSQCHVDWCSNGYPLVTPWKHTGYPLVTPWKHTGYTLVTPWKHTGFTLVTVFHVILQLHRFEIEVDGSDAFEGSSWSPQVRSPSTDPVQLRHLKKMFYQFGSWYPQNTQLQEKCRSWIKFAQEGGPLLTLHLPP